jgi:hypothetical protein
MGDKSRYKFDNTLSPWLNKANKRKVISNFERSGASIYFDIEKNCLEELQNLIPEGFRLEWT